MSGEVALFLDLLTGAFRREHFEEALARAVSASRRKMRPLSVLWIDVDDLTEHDDLHGRNATDAALGWLASKLGQVVDGRGPIGRVGGGAFAVFLDGVGPDEAVALSDRVRRLVPRTLHSSAFGDFRLTVSVGVAGLRAQEPYGNLLEAAEAACTRAKQGGRDGTVTR